MKKVLLLVLGLSYVLLITGCSKTWSGIKQDTSELLLGTKEMIHDATTTTSSKRNNFQDTTEKVVVAKSVAVENMNPFIPTSR